MNAAVLVCCSLVLGCSKRGGDGGSNGLSTSLTLEGVGLGYMPAETSHLIGINVAACLANDKMKKTIDLELKKPTGPGVFRFGVVAKAGLSAVDVRHVLSGNSENSQVTTVFSLTKSPRCREAD